MEKDNIAMRVPQFGAQYLYCSRYLQGETKGGGEMGVPTLDYWDLEQARRSDTDQAFAKEAQTFLESIEQLECEKFLGEWPEITIKARHGLTGFLQNGKPLPVIQNVTLSVDTLEVPEFENAGVQTLVIERKKKRFGGGWEDLTRFQERVRQEAQAWINKLEG